MKQSENFQFPQTNTKKTKNCSKLVRKKQQQRYQRDRSVVHKL